MLLLLGGLWQEGNAQTACSYVISGPGAGTSVDIGGTSVSLGDDAVSGAVPIGFNFNFFGVTYSSAYLVSNGYISFDPAVVSGCCTGQVLPNNTNPSAIVAGFWEDLAPNIGGTIGYGTFGTAPARRFVVSYTGVNHYPSGVPVTFQIKLHESSNVVEIVCIDCTTDGGLHTQGIENAGGSVAFVPSGRNSVAFSSVNETVTFTPVDATAPGLTCPGNISVACTQPVSFGSASGTDNCSFARVTQVAGLASGATFPSGTNTVTFRARDHGTAGVFNNGAGGTFSYNEGDSPQTVALKACESVYGVGNCVIGACGSFTYYYRSGHLSCNCGKTAGQYEFVYANAGYTDVGQDYGGTNAPVTFVPFVRVKGPNGCSVPNTWLVSNDRLGGNFTDCSFTVTVGTGVTPANAGPDQTVCGTAAVLAANTPSVGTGSWSIVAGAGGTLLTPSSPTSGFTGVQGTTYTLRWTIAQAPCASSTDDVIITLSANPTAAGAGPDQNICGNSGTLAGNTPTVGTGTWTIVSGTGGGIVSPTSPNSTVFGASGTTYTLRWTISNAPCTATTDDVFITFVGTPTTANAGPDQTVCGSSATLAGNTPTSGAGSWSIVSGAGGTVTTPSSPTSAFTGVAGTTYTLRWTISNAPCTASSDDVIITLRANPTTSNAGLDQTICATTTTLAGNAATSGAGTWSIIAGAGGACATPTSATSSFTGVAGTTYTLRWTIANAPCAPSTDDVLITMTGGTTTANAGPDQALCATSATLAANTPALGTGAWSIVSGVGGTVTTPSSPSSSFTGVAGNVYTLRWTITNPPCAPTTDDVIITFAGNPTVSNAGPDQNICGTTTTLAGNTPTSGTGTWSVVSGAGGSIATANNPASSFTGVAGTTYTLRWTIANAPCVASTDDVVITMTGGTTVANAGPDDNTCANTTTLAANTLTFGTGSWSIISGAGGSLVTPTSPTSTFNGVTGTSYTLRWTITNAPCAPSTDDVVVTFTTNPSVANAGPDQTICGTTATLAGNTPSAGTGVWSIISGTGGSITTPTSPTSTFTCVAGQVYTLRWTILNPPCSNTIDDVVITTDIVGPAITCPANIAANNDFNACGATVTYSSPAVTDNCPTPTTTQTSGLASGSLFPVGSTTNVFRVTDGTGNTATCSFVVTVTDNQLPGITCPANITANNTVGACTGVATYTAPVGTDNCPGASTTRTGGLASGATFPAGPTTVVYTVTDAVGNMSTCSFVVTVVDAEAPAITCPANVSVNNTTGLCTGIATYTTPNGTDNCTGSSTVQTLGLASGATFPVGPTTNTFRVTDAAGNTTTCSFLVTVADAEVPTISCPPSFTLGTDLGMCTAVIPYPAINGSDNCSGASTVLTAGLPTGVAFPLGATTCAFQVTDAAGNTATCSFTATVTDNELPTINCPLNMTVSTSTLACSATPTYSLPSAADNCSGGSLTLISGIASGGTFPLGVTTNTFRATDAAGNSATCSFTVTVTDQVAPTITCPANITANSQPGFCTATVTFTAPVGSDNCTGASTSQILGLTPGASFPVGVTVNKFQVTDAAGNTGSCAFTVTIVDNQVPSVNCPANSSVNTTVGACTASPAFTTPLGIDNCSGVAVSQTGGLASGSAIPVGVNTNTFVATDASGNTATCSFTITVTDIELPTITCPSNITTNTGVGICGAVVTYNAPVGADNCLSTTTLLAGLASGATFPVGLTTNTYRVTDGAGNSASCSFTVTVNDNVLPTWSACPSPITVGTANNSCTGTATWTAPTASDNCTVSSSSTNHLPGSTFNLGATTVTYTATDGSGNTGTCSFVVTVNDNVAPVALCHNAVVILDPQGNGSLTAAGVDNGSTDNCTIGSLTLSQTAFTCANAGTSTLVLVVTDGSGNTASCTATVTVTAPAVTATASADTANCGFNVSCFGGNDGVAHATASGGCPSFTYQWSSGSTASTATGLAAGTYTCTITDGAGSTQVVTVTLTQPTALQATATSTQSCPGDATGSIDLTATGGNDCQGYTFLWSNGATTEDLSNVVAGDYIVTVSDAGGCSLIDTVTVGAFPAPTPTFTANGNLLTAGQVWSTYQWLLNGGNIPGATGSTHIASQTGSYSLQVTDANGCTGVSDTTNITIVGIADHMGDWSELSIYPNPARGEFRLRTSAPIGYSITVTIHDMYGKRYTDLVLPQLSHEVSFDLKAFSAGTYVVEVVSEFGQRKLFKLVVN